MVDSICGDLCFEEGGTPVRTNVMYACLDAVQADAYGRSLMGLSTTEVPYIELAEQYGAGCTNWSERDLAFLNVPSDCESYVPPTGTVRRLTRHVQQKNVCSACFAALVRALYATGRGGEQDVYIGQGWRGCKLEGLGIGACCRGATTNVPGCPPTADAIANALRRV